MPIEKDIIYIKLANSSLSIECKTNHNTNEIYHRTKSLMKVNTRLLVKAYSNKVSFILCNRIVGIIFFFFDAEHPFVAN